MTFLNFVYFWNSLGFDHWPSGRSLPRCDSPKFWGCKQFSHLWLNSRGTRRPLLTRLKADAMPRIEVMDVRYHLPKFIAIHKSSRIFEFQICSSVKSILFCYSIRICLPFNLRKRFGVIWTCFSKGKFVLKVYTQELPLIYDFSHFRVVFCHPAKRCLNNQNDKKVVG